MKLHPLILFMILILALIVATYFGNTFAAEGFESYSGKGILTDVNVDSYNKSKSVTKLYEDFFYDAKNGNVILLEESDSNSGSKAVSKINIFTRDNTSNSVTYTKGTGVTNFKLDSSESQIKTIKPIYGSYAVGGESSFLLYNAWGNNTHIYVIETNGLTGNTAAGNTVASPALTVTYDGTEQKGSNTNFGNFSIPIASTYPTSNTDTNNNKIVNVSAYGKDVYQIVPTIYYDISNGNLLINTSTSAPTASSLEIYERGESSKSTDSVVNLKEKTFSSFREQPSFISDTVGKNTVIYHPLDDYTQIIVLGNVIETQSDSSKRLKVVKRLLFDKSGIYIPPRQEQEQEQKKDDNKEEEDGDKKIGDNGEELLDAFSKWYMYFYSSDLTDISENSKYLLKTQVVPPVCPACPGCSGNGVCTSCGGNGGSGTQDASGSLAFAQSDGKTLVGATGNAISNTVGATGNVLSNTIGATGNVVNKTVDTAGNVVTGVVGKTLDTAENVVGKTFDTAGNILGTAGRALGLDRVGYSQSYRGPVNTSSSANAQGYNRNTTGYSNLPNGNPQDPYSYNGQLQSKGGNFIPVTADFSRFGR